MTRKFTFTILAMLFAILGPGAKAWGQEKAEYTELFTVTSDDIVSNSSYAAYTKTIDERGWVITFGGNNKSVGTNSGNRSKCNLSNYSKYAVSPVTVSDVASAFVSTTSISDVSKISYTFNGGSNQTNTNVYLIYSSDGNTFSQVTLTSGTQGATISSGTAYEFTKCSGYFGLLFKATNTSGAWRIDDVNITFYKGQSNVPVTGVTLNTGELSLNVGATETLTATVVPDNATNKNVTWSSNQESVATVSESGVVTAVAAGTATITVTTEDGNKTASCNVTVTLNKLATPTNLNATPAPTSAALTWDAVANASSYEVILNSEAKAATTNSLLVEDLIASTTYTWTVKAIGDGTTYADSEASAESNFTTLAPPTLRYTVTFNGNGHGTPATTEITETEPAAGVTLPQVTPNAGYQFVGWATTETATEADAGKAGDTYHPTANITLYAVYNEVYTITWSVNGAPTTEGNPTTSVVEGEGITTLPTTPASISGMAFQGWTATQIATSSATAPTDLFTDAEHAPAITANTTFYAVFAEESEGDVTWNNVTTLAGITEGQYVIINGSFYLTNTTVTNTGPTAGDAPTISNNIIADANVTATMKWSFTSTGTTNQFYVKNSNDDYLYATSANNGVRVSNTSDKWTFAENTSGYFSMKEANNSRYCAKYTNGSDWRSYTSATHENYVNEGKLELYKKTQDITYTYYTNVVVKVLTSISLSGEYPTEFWKGEAFSHDGMMVTAHYENADDEDVTSKAEFSTPDMSTVGVKTVTVSYETASKTYDITVKTIANNAETAYTVEEAKAIIDANPAELTTESVYVKGTVSKIVTAYSSDFGNITFDVSADGQTTGDQFQFYRNFKDAGNTHWASAAECPAVGDDVIGYGMMQKHNSTYEFGAGNYIVSLIRFATLSIDDITVEIGETITPEITTNVPDEYTIAYSVASEDVVKVDNGNLVTVAVGGPVEVTATLTAEGYKSAETTFTVEVIKALQSIAVKTAPTTSYKAGDFFNPEGLVITATYSDASTGDIAYEGNEDKFTFVPSLETALTTGITSVTITYADKASTTQAITVRALYTYNITWMANGEQFTTTEVTESDALVLPETNPANVGDMKFQGWINTENYYNAEAAPDYIVPSEIIPAADAIYYAVYAKEQKDIQETTSTMDFSEETYSDWEIYDKIVRTANEGTGGTGDFAGRINTNNTYITFNKKVKVESFGFSFKRTSTNSNYNVYIETSTDNETWTAHQTYPMSDFGNGSYTTKTDDTFDGKTDLYVRFHCYNTTATRYVDDVIIQYMGEDITYSNFCTTVKPIEENTTISENATWEGNYTINGHIIKIGSGVVLTVNGALINTDPEKLIIEDGGQLIHHNAGVAATVKKNITGYTNAQGHDGYYLIANPTNNATVANLTNNNYDLYTFNPAGDGNGNEWINMKNLSMDVENGIGYLYANSIKTTLEFAGNLTPAGSSNIELTYANAGEGFDFPGFNLIGNPFACNAYPTDGNGNFMPFYKTNETGSELTLVKNVEAIAPCEGFFVEAEEDGQTVVITTEESEVESSALSLTVSQNRGSVIDRAIVSFNGSANLHKFMLNPSHTNLSIAKDGETFAAVSSETKGELPVSFKAETTGTYTISVNTENVTAGYIHLIDNMTGTDVDLLATPSYTFIGSPRDNENRFTLKFEVSYGQDGDGDEHFVYQNGSELVVNGEGTLQIFDVLGRVVISEEVHGQTVYVGNLSEGAYIVRMTGESVKTQKIVVR
ncbi:MAG: Ig-like domain-containing protein [Bacteroidales bacterium]|nr:Ig-like domain-containing protein [Bacteroidales bacterium]